MVISLPDVNILYGLVLAWAKAFVEIAAKMNIA